MQFVYQQSLASSFGAFTHTAIPFPRKQNQGPINASAHMTSTSPPLHHRRPHEQTQAKHQPDRPHARPRNRLPVVLDADVQPVVHDARGHVRPRRGADGVLDAGQPRGQHGGREQRQVLEAVAVRALGALVLGERGGGHGALQVLREGAAVRVGVGVAAVVGALDQADGVEVRDERRDVHGRDGEEG